MTPFDEDPSENKTELDLCIDEIHELQTQLTIAKDKNDEDVKRSVKVAVSIIMKSVIEIIGIDGHSWSDRPCQTCRAVSGLIGEPFGCYWYQENRNGKNINL